MGDQDQSDEFQTARRVDGAGDQGHQEEKDGKSQRHDQQNRSNETSKANDTLTDLVRSGTK